MANNFRINTKMLLYVLGITALFYLGSLGYISYKMGKATTESASVISRLVAVDNAYDAQRLLNRYLSASSTMSNLFGNIDQIPEERRREYVLDVMHDVIAQNPEYLSVWSIWNPNSIDSFDEMSIGTPGSTYIGSFSPGWYRQNDEIKLEVNSGTELFQGDYFTLVRDCGCSRLLEPYYYSYTGNSKDSILQTNMVTPIFINGEFSGVVGIDASLNYFQNKFQQIHPLETGNVYLLSNLGSIVAGPDAAMVNKNISSVFDNIISEYNISERIAQGQFFEFKAKNPYTGKKSLFYFQPIFIGDSPMPWSFCIVIPRATIFKDTLVSITKTAFVGIVGLMLFIIVIGLFAKSISVTVVKIGNSLKELAQGNISKTQILKKTRKDELGILAEGVDKLYNSLNSAATFANQIGQGNLNAEYKLLSHKDELGNSLLEMQKSLIVAHGEEEKKKIEDANRNWVTHGLAKFGEVIRHDNDNMAKFSLNVISELVKYMNVAQAAIYINETNDYDEFSDDEFVLKAAMAYGKPVMLDRRIKKGTEIIGRAADEDRMIHIKNLPEDYVDLSPGRKDMERPRQLLVSPLSINDLTYGVIEILAYDPFQDHHIEFIEKLSENVASVISSVKTNIQTARLLEQSQFQADELTQHEEEMRQNLEEMQATQEEAAKRQSSLMSYINSIKKSLMVVELDFKGRIIDVSPLLMTTYALPQERLQGKYFNAFIAQTEELRQAYTEFWEDLLRNGKGRRKHIVKQRNKELHLVEEYIVIEQERANPKILMIVIDRSRDAELQERLIHEKKAVGL